MCGEGLALGQAHPWMVSVGIHTLIFLDPLDFEKS
jgi:hypothetical protein